MSIDVNALPTEQRDALDEAVHDLASQQASTVINSGGQFDFLLAAGWSADDIMKAVPGLVLAPFGEVWGLKDKWVRVPGSTQPTPDPAASDTAGVVTKRAATPAKRVEFFNTNGVKVGEAIETPSGLMVWGRDLGFDDDTNLISLDMADDLDYAARRIQANEVG